MPTRRHAPIPSAAAAAIDPLPALAARFFAIDAQTRNASAEDDDAAYERWAAAADACYAMVPETPAGALALLDVILSRESDFIDEQVVLKALQTLRAGLAVIARR